MQVGVPKKYIYMKRFLKTSFKCTCIIASSGKVSKQTQLVPSINPDEKNIKYDLKLKHFYDVKKNLISLYEKHLKSTASQNFEIG